MKGFGINNQSENNREKFLQSNIDKEKILHKAFHYHAKGDIAKASKYYQFFINKGYKDHRVFLNCGEILKDLGKVKEAEIWIKRAIELNPDYAIAYNNLGNIFCTQNKLREAEKCFLKVISLNPALTKAYVNLSNLPYSERNNIWQNKLFSQDFLCDKSKDDQLNIYFARANILHKKKNYDESAKCLQLANQLKISLYPSNSKELINKSKVLLLESNKENIILKKKKDDPQKIFIVGMPRSGSTLVESIVSMNNKLIDLGEVNILEQSFIKWKASKKKIDLIDLYQQTISKNFELNITSNKWLENYQYTGIILNNIPTSKIIHCFRNPLDNILSIYRAHFTKGFSYASSLIDCAIVYLDQAKIMSEYKEKFPSKIYELNYDLLVKNPSKEIKSLINWLEWDWNESYLNPHLNTRSVFTASNVQVRSKINSKSVGSWRNYKKMLKPAIEIISQHEKYQDFFS